MSPNKNTSMQPEHNNSVAGKRVIVAVTGGIAAYKTCILVRRLIGDGAEVQVLMTDAATQFVTPLTFSTLSGRPVQSEMFPTETPVDPIHLTASHWGELLVIAPATANIIGKLANGIADDLVSTIALAFRGPILIAPAMNPDMWRSPAVQHNLETLCERGYFVVGPESGEMGGRHELAGPGRMSEPEVILGRVEELLSGSSRLAGLKVIVTSGPTRELIDPVRYISNFSSGKMGDAIASEARQRGAQVTLIRGKGANDQPPVGVELVAVDSAREMAEAVKSRFGKNDCLVMAAAVADWTPANPRGTKIKKDGTPIEIEWSETEDILAWAGKNKSNQIVVGFALETDNHVERARRKLEQKGADIIVLNDATKADSAFGGDYTRLTILHKGGEMLTLDLLSKRAAAARLLDEIEIVSRNGR